MAKQATINLIELHPLQQEIIDHPARFKVVACGRRVGKTELCKDVIANAVIETNLPYAYFAPTYKNMREVWESIKVTLAPIIVKVNEQEKRLEFVTGAIVDFWSMDKLSAEVARGRKYKGVLLDEAAKVAGLETAWNEVIRPMLMDYRGWAMFYSTPKGRNFFWTLYNRGIDPLETNWHSWQRPTTDNPHIPADEIELARKELPSHAFKQEILAEFLEGDGMVFRGVTEVCTGEPMEPIAGHDYVFGVDWGKSNDFTVISIYDVTASREVFIDRFNQISWQLQRGRLQSLASKYKPRLILAESNSIGEPQIEELERAGLPVRGFQTTSASKGQLVDSLALNIEQQLSIWLKDAVAMNELQSYEMERLPSGNWRYSCPENMHDDTVIARMLAWHAAGMRPVVATVRRGNLFGGVR